MARCATQKEMKMFVVPSAVRRISGVRSLTGRHRTETPLVRCTAEGTTLKMKCRKGT